MNVVNDIILFCGTLSVEDYIFFFAVIVLFVLVVSLFYFIKIEDKQNPLNELEAITKKIEKEYKAPKIEFSNFEKEQEAEAIISYGELLENAKKLELNYDQEIEVDGLTVKKVSNTEIYNEVKNDDFEIKL